MTRERRPETEGPHQKFSPRELDRFDEHVLPWLDAANNLARYLLRDAHEAEDAVQEAFVRAISHFADFRGADGRAWLLTIVRNSCFTQLRRRRSGGEKVEFDEEMHTVEDTASGPEADLERTIAAASVREGLDHLAVEFREVLVLRELEGMSYKEIAQVTGTPIGTVMSRLARGRRQLAVALGATFEEEE